MQISLVLPCFNEEQNIGRTVADVAEWFRADGIVGEIIVVNDGSKDGTAEVLQALEKTEPLLKVVHHPVNRGYGAAVTTGCDAATSEWIAFMDSDGQFHAEDFRLLIPFCADYGFVTGRRRKRADPFMRKMNAKGFGILSFFVLGIWVRDINCAMKIFRSDVWKKVRPQCASGALVNAEIFLRLKRQRISWKQVDVPHYPRLFGIQTGAKISVILRMLKEMWKLRRSAVSF